MILGPIGTFQICVSISGIVGNLDLTSTRDLPAARLGYFPGEEIFQEILMADGMQDTEAQEAGSGVPGLRKIQTMTGVNIHGAFICISIVFKYIYIYSVEYIHIYM